MRIKMIKVMIDGQEVEVAVMKDGKPVYVDDGGQDVAVDVPHMFKKITDLNAESKTHREAAEAANQKLAAYNNVDPVAAIKALETIGNLDSKKLIDAGEVEKVKQQVASVYEEKLKKVTDDSVAQIAAKDSEIYKLVVSNEFAKSPLINGDKSLITLPPDIAEATFGKHFKIEEGKMVAYLGDDKIFSKERAGELANFDEALSVIINKYPMKERILRGSGASGSGAHQNNQNRGGQDNNNNLSSVNKIAAGLKELGA